jgi:radical SAM superfamily enzyme YgiQ (UPF0313 family)
LKLLLINPKFPESFWSFQWAFDHIFPAKKTLTSPLGLATIAALSPSAWEITIMDENVEPIDWNFPADIVGVCGMGVQFTRQKEILEKFRGKGIYVVAGGSYASLCPEQYYEIADSVISGEAEYIWPQFCADFEIEKTERLYRQEEEVDLQDSPVPRYDLLKIKLYFNIGVQFSRGCPFLCEFCDIIVMFGRKPRTKSFRQIERELDALRALNVHEVFFVDDNLIGHLPQSKKLLAFLNQYQQQNNYTFTFGTEASINVAADPSLLELFKKANFGWVFIGIETPSQEALLETRKNQNTRKDLLESVRTIYSFGMDVFASFIVGFDADDDTIFDRQFQFISESGIILSAVGLLTAIPSTPLFNRLQRENRLNSNEFQTITNPFGATNLIPLRMSYDQMIYGYQNLQKLLITEENIYRRLSNKFQFLKNASLPSDFSSFEILICSLRFLIKGLVPGGLKRWYYFILSLIGATKNSVRLPHVIIHWIYGISFKEFWSKAVCTVPRPAGS